MRTASFSRQTESIFLGSDGFLHVQDTAGIDRLRIQQAYISGTLKGKITSATATKVNGKDALTLEFTIVTTRDDDVTAYGCTAVATVADGGFFNVVFDITTPDSFTLGSYTQVVRRFILRELPLTPPRSPLSRGKLTPGVESHSRRQLAWSTQHR